MCDKKKNNGDKELIKGGYQPKDSERIQEGYKPKPQETINDSSQCKPPQGGSGAQEPNKEDKNK